MSIPLSRTERAHCSAITDLGRRLAEHNTSGFRHRSNPARPGAPRDPVPPSLPPRPTSWRIWLLFAGLLLSLSLFTGRTMTKAAAPSRDFSFTNFVAQIDANE